jgi:hypothetical protein
MPKVKLNVGKRKGTKRAAESRDESQLYKMTIKGKTVNVTRSRRVLLKDDQTTVLERVFQRLRKDQDPNSNDPAKRWLIIPASMIDRLSKKIGLTTKKVRKWFANRQQRQKDREKKDADAAHSLDALSAAIGLCK